MKKHLLLLLLILSVKSFSQKDSIVNYLNKKGSIVAKNEARYFEIITKEKESLWLVKRFIKNNGKIKKISFFKTSKKETQIGEEILYNLKGEVIGIRNYNNSGKKHGKATKWFGNKNVDIEGGYKDGKQVGTWKFYHTNGKLSAEKIYKNGELEKEIFYDEKGEKLPKGVFINEEEKHFFKGGKENYNKKIKVFNYKLNQFKKKKKINYKFKGKVIVRYMIDIDGKIKDVTIDEPMPKDMYDFIVDWFGNLKGWTTKSKMNRKIPVKFSQPLNFR